MPIVMLTKGEGLHAGLVGLTRQIDNLYDRRHDVFGHQGDPWGTHVRGAMAEKAVAKLLRRYWSGNLGNLRAADAGSRLEVRATTNEQGRLIVHPVPKDAPDHAFVLVIGEWPRYRVVGWLWGHEAQTERWWADPAGGRPAFFVPQEALRNFAGLPEEVL